MGDTDTTVQTWPADLDDPRLYVNRELSFLAFNQRVLDEAEDPATPLLERVKLLAIAASNLAEFFMVRVAGLKQQEHAGVTEATADGMTPKAQLAAIRPVTLEMMGAIRRCLHLLLERLADEGVRVVDYEALTPTQRTWADEHFRMSVFPVLTPLAFDPGRPFPHISNLSLNLAVVVQDADGERHFARLKIPDTLPRLVEVPPDPDDPAHATESRYYLWIDQLISNNLPQLFPEMECVESHPFRVVRDAEIEIQELEADDLLGLVERTVRQRRFGAVVRLTVETGMPPFVSEILAENLNVDREDIFVVEPPLGVSTLMGLYDIDRPDLKHPPFLPRALRAPDDTPEIDLFAAIRTNDILLHHPYDSFSPVVEFLECASRDPEVLAIKQTLYRVGSESPVVAALLDAARRGKQVSVLVELKARFDEESNIEWARQFEAEGVHVVYGLIGLKTHSKMALVIRREGGEIRRYLHLGTGNYNATTARQYTDIGLLTCDERMGIDASDVFNLLTGYSEKRDYDKLIVAPVTLRRRIRELIEREIASAERGEEAHLIFKLNAVVDQDIIRRLYRASQAGVKIDLIARGVCCLRPGVPGVSDNIRVVSIVGRFLEHSRIFYFWNGGDEEILVGSADLMPRNLDRRVEVLFPVEDPRLVRRLRDDILAVYLADNVKTRIMQADGSYVRVRPREGEPQVDAQEQLITAHAPGRAAVDVPELDAAPAPEPAPDL